MATKKFVFFLLWRFPNEEKTSEVIIKFDRPVGHVHVFMVKHHSPNFLENHVTVHVPNFSYATPINL